MSVSSSGAVASSELDYSDWLSRTETVEDTASLAVAQQLEALLDRSSTTASPDAQAPSPKAGEQMFPLGHWLQFTPTTPGSGLGEDGHPKLGGFLPPFPYPRRMWAGSRISFHEPIKLGQQITKTTTIESITPKEGRSGKLIFLGLRHDVMANDTLALTEQQTIVYREAPSPESQPFPGAQPPRSAPTVPTGWDWTEKIQPNEVQLFRFSALTFNSHRIHYDLPYATEVEGYPGLVVHGPYSATLIMAHFLEHRDPTAIASFQFSARSPLFVNEQAYVCGRSVASEDSDLNVEELAVYGPENTLTVEARIEYHA